uniref:RNA binding motif protein 39b n=1 Tax=Amphilophus citrinellus TaxID=61819 RepID=A0A3Q0T5B5_AMPCI
MADDFDVEAMLEAPYRKGKMCDRGGIELLQSKNENGISFSGRGPYAQPLGSLPRVSWPHGGGLVTLSRSG